jgi:hypothetical protein
VTSYRNWMPLRFGWFPSPINFIALSVPDILHHTGSAHLVT